jgi:hypothetical protein
MGVGEAVGDGVSVGVIVNVGCGVAEGKGGTVSVGIETRVLAAGVAVFALAFAHPVSRVSDNRVIKKVLITIAPIHAKLLRREKGIHQ